MSDLGFEMPKLPDEVHPAFTGPWYCLAHSPQDEDEDGEKKAF